MRGGPRGRVLTGLRHGAPLAAAGALALVLGANIEPDHDLQLQAPSRLARDAESVPVRAQIYSGLRRPEGPKVVAQPVAVQLETPTGRVLSRAQLSNSAVLGPLRDLQGGLPIPSGSPANLRIAAQVSIDDQRLHVAVPLTLEDDPEPIAPVSRPLRQVQQLAASPVLENRGSSAPSGLRVRVRGGACVPEQRCRVLVHVGEPAAALRVEPNATLSVVGDPARDAAETSGVVAFEVTTHGPEAELWLRALRGGARVASRTVRLPVALGSLSADASGLVLDQAAQLSLTGHAADGGCIVDAFRSGHWSATGSFEACERSNALPFALPRGFSRVQLRRDAFSAELAAVALVYVRGEAETPSQVVAAFASAALGSAPDDAFARGCALAPEACVSHASLSYLAALLEEGIAPLPRPASGYAHSVTLLQQRRDRLLSLSLWALFLGGISLALSIGRSGMAAGLRASRLLDMDPGIAWRARLRAYALAAASAGALFLVFVVLALYVLARGGY